MATRSISDHFLALTNDNIDDEVIEQLEEFYEKIPPLEKSMEQKIIIHEDKCSKVNSI